MPSGIEVLCSVATLWQTTASVRAKEGRVHESFNPSSWDQQLYVIPSGALSVVCVYQCLSMPGTHSSSFGRQI